MEYQICFKDVNPDNEEEFLNETSLAVSEDLKAAMWIKGALEIAWVSDESEEKPNRVFFVNEIETDDSEEETN